MSKREKFVFYICVSVIVVVILVLFISGSTYAYLAAITDNGIFDTGSGELGISYVAPSNLTGELLPTPSRENGLKAIATASLNAGSVDALFNMYITPTALTNLNIPALRWEVEGISGGTTVYTNSGDFSSATVDNAIKIVDGYALTNASTIFNIYIWLDASKITTAISDASFGAKIGADSVPITGEF